MSEALKLGFPLHIQNGKYILSYLLDQQFSNNSIFLSGIYCAQQLERFMHGANRAYQHSSPMGGRKVMQAIVGGIATKIARITIDG